MVVFLLPQIEQAYLYFLYTRNLIRSHSGPFRVVCRFLCHSVVGTTSMQSLRSFTCILLSNRILSISLTRSYLTPLLLRGLDYPSFL